jgi:hypothetical protein
VLEDSQSTQKSDISFDAIRSTAKSFNTITVKQERYRLKREELAQYVVLHFALIHYPKIDPSF